MVDALDIRSMELMTKALRIITNALQEAEMRQGCSNHEYYAEILLDQIEPLIYEYAPSNKVLIRWGIARPKFV